MSKRLFFNIEIKWNINPKSIKNQSKIHQTWTKHLSKIIKNRGLEGSGAGLEASWAVLGDPKRLWRHLGLSWKRLGGVLEGSWRPLGRSLAEKGGQHGSNLAPKTEPKSIKNRYQNWSIFQCLLESIFGRILVNLGCQNEAKLNPKWDQKPMLTSKGDFSKNLIFLKEKPRFLRSNRSKLGAKMDQKSIKK